ncbi:MAG TPA: M48 family metallopeptidase [Jiangellaceae bacterium]
MPKTTVEIRRSRRRKRTVTAFREAGKVVVCMPATFTKAQEQRWVSTMLKRLDAADARRRPSDDGLLARAKDLSRRYLDGRAGPVSVRWSTNQNSRWGSCTPADASIRVSDRLKGVPPWVLDYVLVHELAHLLMPDHGDEFWALVNRYPRTERARGFLDGLTHAAGLPADNADAF